MSYVKCKVCLLIEYEGPEGGYDLSLPFLSPRSYNGGGHITPDKETRYSVRLSRYTTHAHP